MTRYSGYPTIVKREGKLTCTCYPDGFYRMEGGKFGPHAISNDVINTTTERLNAHWAGYVKANR